MSLIRAVKVYVENEYFDVHVTLVRPNSRFVMYECWTQVEYLAKRRVAICSLGLYLTALVTQMNLALVIFGIVQ